MLHLRRCFMYIPRGPSARTLIELLDAHQSCLLKDIFLSRRAYLKIKMSTRIETISGHAIPPAPRHSITIHLPGWQNLLRFADRDQELIATFKSMYPRMMVHRDIKEVRPKSQKKLLINENAACQPDSWKSRSRLSESKELHPICITRISRGMQSFCS